MAEISDCELSVVTYRWTHGLFQHRFVEHPSVTQVLQIFRVSNNRMKMKKVLKEMLTIRHMRLQLLQGKTRSAAAQNSRRPHFLNLEFRRTVVRKQTTGYSGIVHLFLLSLFWPEIILKGPLICRTPVALDISVCFFLTASIVIASGHIQQKEKEWSQIPDTDFNQLLLMNTFAIPHWKCPVWQLDARVLPSILPLWLWQTFLSRRGEILVLNSRASSTLECPKAESLVFEVGLFGVGFFSFLGFLWFVLWGFFLFGLRGVGCWLVMGVCVVFLFVCFLILKEFALIATLSPSSSPEN